MDIKQIRNSLTGPVGSVSTPFNRDGSIDFAGLDNMVDHYISAGSRSIVLTYGDSLYSVLSDQEVGEVTKAVVECASGRASVVAADRIWATPKEVEFARYVRKLGADQLMVLPPDWGASATVESMVEHYSAVSAEIPVMVVTNVFIPRGASFGLNVIEALLEREPKVVSIKDDFGGEFGRKMARLVHHKWAILSGGQKQRHLDMHPYGCDSYLSTFIIFRPEVAHAYQQAIECQNLPAAVDIIEKFDWPLFDFANGMPGGFDAAVHGLIELSGIAQRWRRPPYYNLSDEEMEQLRCFLKSLPLIG